MTEPIVKNITVPTTPNEAFRIFTADMANWWPLESHSRSAVAGTKAKTVEMDLKVGGNITETMQDGSPGVWGVITEFEPGKRVAFTWHLSRGTGEHTLVTVTFEPTENGTAVQLVHSGFDAMRADANQQREQYNSGWVLVFEQRFGGANWP